MNEKIAATHFIIVFRGALLLFIFLFNEFMNQKNGYKLQHLMQSGAYAFALRLCRTKVGDTLSGVVDGIWLRGDVHDVTDVEPLMETGALAYEGYVPCGITISVRDDDPKDGLQIETDFFMQEGTGRDEALRVTRLIQDALAIIRRGDYDPYNGSHDGPPDNGSDGPDGSIPRSV